MHVLFLNPNQPWLRILTSPGFSGSSLHRLHSLAHGIMACPVERGPGIFHHHPQFSITGRLGQPDAGPGPVKLADSTRRRAQ